MKKRFLCLLSLLLVLAGCTNPGAQTPTGSQTPAPEDGASLSVLATTYPVYLFANAVVGDVPGVTVQLLVNQSVSCLHDYTLTVNDMKAIEAADVIAINGVGLEDFLADALGTSERAVIDCAQGVDLLPYHGHEGHNHDHETEAEGDHFDPHIWMDPNRAVQMVHNLAQGLSALDGDNAQAYLANASAAADTLNALDAQLNACLTEGETAPVWRELITFHEGFAYFADAYDLSILMAIEEEEGAEASAQEIREIVGLIDQHGLPALFTEVNGSDATAQAIARETNVEVLQLSMVMSGDSAALDAYCAAMLDNAQTIAEALS